MDISMDIHGKSVDMDMDGKFHIHGKPGGRSLLEVRDYLPIGWNSGTRSWTRSRTFLYSSVVFFVVSEYATRNE